MKQMNATEFAALLAEGVKPIMIDVREEHELSHGVIDNITHIPMQQIPDKLPQLADNKDKTTVIICRTGNRSNTVGQFLEQNGFTDVINLAGGMNSWASDVDTSMTVY